MRAAAVVAVADPPMFSKTQLKFPVGGQRSAGGRGQGGHRRPSEEFEARRAEKDLEAAPGPRVLGSFPVQREQRRELAERKRLQHAGIGPRRKQSQLDILRGPGRHQPDVHRPCSLQGESAGGLHPQSVRQGRVEVQGPYLCDN